MSIRTSVTIELSPEREAAIKAQAAREGLPLEQWFVKVADQHVPGASEPHLQRTDPEEWMRRFRAWAQSHSRDTPLLSEEAMSRESIYADRI